MYPVHPMATALIEAIEEQDRLLLDYLANKIKGKGETKYYIIVTERLSTDHEYEASLKTTLSVNTIT